MTDYYTKKGVDAQLALKANATDVAALQKTQSMTWVADSTALGGGYYTPATTAAK